MIFNCQSETAHHSSQIDGVIAYYLRLGRFPPTLHFPIDVISLEVQPRVEHYWKIQILRRKFYIGTKKLKNWPRCGYVAAPWKSEQLYGL